MPPRALIEFPADDTDRARRFWSGLLGLELVTRAPGEGAGWQAEVGAGALGVHARGAGPGDTAALPYLTVADLDQAVTRIGELGGRVIHRGTQWTICRDSEGSAFALSRAPEPAAAEPTQPAAAEPAGAQPAAGATALARPLRRADLDLDPLVQFRAWFADANRAGVEAPEAAALATATPEGRPSCRMVLVKTVDVDGFALFTNYASRKGEELAANPWAALLFHWDALERQVRVEGPVVRVSRAETVTYAHSRGRASQLSALASAQSRPIDGRAELEERVAALAAEHPESELPVAETWGGVRLNPERFEFWQGGEARLHDRFAYTPAATGWSVVRLQP